MAGDSALGDGGEGGAAFIPWGGGATGIKDADKEGKGETCGCHIEILIMD